MPKKVGIELVAEGEAQYSQAAKQAAESTVLLSNEILKLVEAQSKTIDGARYAAMWKEALEGTRQEYEKFWSAAGQAEQEATVASAQHAEQYVQFWVDALNERSAAEQEATVKSAQAANEYVRFWEEALAKRDKTGTNPAGKSIFDDPERAAQMQADNARIAAEAIAQANEIAGKSAVQAASHFEMLQKQLIETGMSATEAAATLTALGVVNDQVTESALSDAEAAKIVEATHKRVSQTYADQEKQIKLLGGATDETAKSHNRLTESAVQSSRAFFALTLASFGVMSVTQELKKSFGDDLPVAFEKTSAAIQQVASFGSAGAFIGGVPGAVLGGIAGGLIAVTTASISLDPALQQLNTQLDNLSNRDEVVNTLTEVADVSKKTAEIWLEAASKDPTFAQTLEDAVKAAEPMPGLLATINEGVKGLSGSTDALGKSFGDLGDTANKALLLIFGVLNGVGEAFEIVRTGGGTVEENWGRINERIWEVLTNVTKATEGGNISKEKANDLTRQANAILEENEKNLDKAAAAQKRYADAIADTNFRLAQLGERTANQYASALQTFNNAASDAAEQRYNTISDAEQNLTNRIADLWQDLQNRVADINQGLADKISDIQIGLANKIADIQAQLGFRIQDIHADLADKLQDIDQDLANKLEDLAHKRQSDINKANQAIEDAAKDLSRKLYEIERDRLDSLERLAFNTHEQLQDARTSHDRDRIIRRAQFEQSQIDQEANNARRDAMADYEDEVAQAQLTIQLAQDTYDYEVNLAKKLAEQKRQEARETADQQIAQAQRQAAFQIEQAQRQAAIQMAQAEREAAQQLALAQRRHEQELASAQRTYEQQVAAARRAEEQRLADAQRALEQRNAAIAQAAELERQQIEYTRQKAIQSYLDQIAAIGGLINFVRLLMQQLLEVGGMYEALAQQAAAVTTNLFDDWISGMQGAIDTMNQPPTDQNTQPVLPDLPSPLGLPGSFTGESVRPPSVSNNNRSININMPIYDATDPVKVGNQVRQVLQNTLAGIE